MKEKVEEEKLMDPFCCSENESNLKKIDKAGFIKEFKNSPEIKEACHIISYIILRIIDDRGWRNPVDGYDGTASLFQTRCEAVAKKSNEKFKDSPEKVSKDIDNVMKSFITRKNIPMDRSHKEILEDSLKELKEKIHGLCDELCQKRFETGEDLNKELLKLCKMITKYNQVYLN